MRLMRFIWYCAFTVLALSIVAAFPLPAVGDVGVGVDLAEINVDEVLTTGNTYDLPAVGVVNTGDHLTDYEVVITYMKEQKELIPPADWFEFDPQSFSLEAGISKKVNTSLHIPQDASPGQYFALIEAHPVMQGSSGTAIAVAAATKLRFSVKKGSDGIPVLSDIADFFSDHAPYTYIGLGIILAAILAILVRRFFKFRFNVERR